ncbi:hypothetical protein TrCOL_g13613 [Triparma columacea]|uniref:BZIP domain-containing protein n=1 Tax=Triparma columacea TaxID=722753 RepID=A0A9W7FXH4_9STRA|nr:hypothetical protein TrCOL_g13613 [Triparma columacea]
MPTPPDFLASWNQEEDLLNFFLNSGGTGTGLTPPLPSFSSGSTPGTSLGGGGVHPGSQQQRAYLGPPPTIPTSSSGVFQSISEYGAGGEIEGGDDDDDDENGVVLTTPMQHHYYRGGGNNNNPNLPTSRRGVVGGGRGGGGGGGVRSMPLGVNDMTTSELVPTPPTFVDGMPVLGDEQVINHLSLPHHGRRGVQVPGGGGVGVGGGGGGGDEGVGETHYGMSSSLPGRGGMEGMMGGIGGGGGWQGPGSLPNYGGGGYGTGYGGGGAPPPPPATTGGRGGRGQGGMTQEERRARRLARNRESARQSRRRKKEYLQLLASKVKMLNDGIEEERRKRMDESEEAFSSVETRWRQEIGKGSGGKALKEWFDNTSPGCEERNIAADFQWRQASMAVLPGHRKFLVWLNGRDDGFFKKNKAVHNERVSSKQLGERLTAEGKGGKCKGEDKFWPLFCYDMSFSYDQEERLVAAIKQRVSGLHGSKLLEADKVVDTLGTAVKLGMGREERTVEEVLFGIMTEEQAGKWVEWKGGERMRLKEFFGMEGKNDDIKNIVEGGGRNNDGKKEAEENTTTTTTTTTGGRGMQEAGADLEQVKEEIRILREIGDRLVKACQGD